MAHLRTLPHDRALELRAEGHSFREIAEILTSEGVAPPRGGRWFETSVRRLLAEPSALMITAAALQVILEGADIDEAIQGLLLKTIEGCKAASFGGTVAIAVPRGYRPPGLQHSEGTCRLPLWSISGCRSTAPVDASIIGRYLGEVIVEMPSAVDWEVPRMF